MGTHQRSILFPLGNHGYPSVAFGNLACCRTVLVICLALCRGLRVLLEQPQGSKAEMHPRLAWLFNSFKAWKKQDTFNLRMLLSGLAHHDPAWCFLLGESQTAVVILER